MPTPLPSSFVPQPLPTWLRALALRLVRRRATAAHLFLVATAVAALRVFGEHLAILEGKPMGRSPIVWWLHNAIFYVALAISITAVMTPWLKLGARRLQTLVTLGLFLGILPPVIDFFVYGPGKFAYRYQRGLGVLPWSLYSPPDYLPVGETIVLWLSVLLVLAVGGVYGARLWHKLAPAVLMYGLIFWFLAVLPTLAGKLQLLDPSVSFLEWMAIGLLSSALGGELLNSRLVPRFVARLPQLLLAPLLCWVGAAYVGVPPLPAAYAASVLFLQAAGFALSNDYYDWREDRAQGRRHPITCNTVAVVCTLPYFAVLTTLGTRPDLGLLLLAFGALSHLYHAPPFRLKAVPVLGYGLEGMLAGLALAAGVFAVPGRYPSTSQALALVAATLSAPWLLAIKDDKDVDGDRQGGIPTVVVWLTGRQWRRRSVQALLLMPILLALATGIAIAHAHGVALPILVALSALAGIAACSYLVVTNRSRAFALTLLICEGYLALLAFALTAAVST